MSGDLIGGYVRNLAFDLNSLEKAETQYKKTTDYTLKLVKDNLSQLEEAINSDPQIGIDLLEKSKLLVDSLITKVRPSRVSRAVSFAFKQIGLSNSRSDISLQVLQTAKSLSQTLQSKIEERKENASESNSEPFLDRLSWKSSSSSSSSSSGISLEDASERPYVFSEKGTSSILEARIEDLEKAVKIGRLSNMSDAMGLLEIDLYQALAGCLNHPDSLHKIPSNASIQKAFTVVDILEENVNGFFDNYEIKGRVSDLKNMIRMIAGIPFEKDPRKIFSDSIINKQLEVCLEYLKARKPEKSTLLGLQTRDSRELKRLGLGRLFFLLKKADAEGLRVEERVLTGILSVVSDPATLSKNKGFKAAIRNLTNEISEKQEKLYEAISRSPSNEEIFNKIVASLAPKGKSAILESPSIELENALESKNESLILSASKKLMDQLDLCIADSCNSPNKLKKLPTEESLRKALEVVDRLSRYSSKSLTPLRRAAEIQNRIAILRRAKLDVSITGDSGSQGLIKNQVAVTLRKLQLNAEGDIELEKKLLTDLFITLNKAKSIDGFQLDRSVLEGISAFTDSGKASPINLGLKDSISDLVDIFLTR